MGGCAGGLSGGLMAAFGARLRPGAEFVLDRVGFDARLARADLAITGEGQLDAQSLGGKIVGDDRRALRPCGRAARGDRRPRRPRARGGRAAGIATVTEASTLERIAAAAGQLSGESRGDGDAGDAWDGGGAKS